MQHSTVRVCAAMCALGGGWISEGVHLRRHAHAGSLQVCMASPDKPGHMLLSCAC